MHPGGSRFDPDQVHHAGVAQLAERLPCKQEVGGSSPFASSGCCCCVTNSLSTPRGMMSCADAGKLGHQKASKNLALFLAEKSKQARKVAEGKVCKGCGTPLPYEKRRNSYCSHSCASCHTQKGVPRRLTICCSRCGKSFRPKSRGHRYCSGSCATQARLEALTERWLKGQAAGGSWYGIAGYARRWLVQQQGERCALCGWAEVNPRSGKIPLQVNHIDGNPENHRPGNLQLLCPNCHSLTPSFGGLNRGNGRKQRYAQARALKTSPL